MHDENLNSKIANATKWSSITEIMSKIVRPITNMILARILVPEAFGVLATVNMIISFVDMFTDAGFQKYLVQHEFADDDEKYKSAHVAFWTNLCISFVLLGFIVLFREPIARLVGNPGLGNVIAIASLQLPLTSFSSIQMALYRRDFDFKTLFWVRIALLCIPFIVTIPLALLGLSYWSLVIGTLGAEVSTAVILTVKSKWKPKWFYDVRTLKKMFSFSFWALVESIATWFILWADVLIIGSTLSQYYVGLYKTSVTMVNGIMNIIVATMTPILYSALSRLQYDPIRFNRMYHKIQRLISIIVFPLGVGIYLYRDFATRVLLGSQWAEASGIIGIWALTRSIMIVFGNLCSEAYRAKGKPKLSFWAQVFHLVVLIPVCIISAKQGFWSLVYARSWIQMQAVLVHFIIMWYVIGIPVWQTLRNVIPTAVSAVLMGAMGYVLQRVYTGMAWDFITILICIGVYFGILCLFPVMRSELKILLKGLRSGSDI